MLMKLQFWILHFTDIYFSILVNPSEDMIQAWDLTPVYVFTVLQLCFDQFKNKSALKLMMNEPVIIPGLAKQVVSRGAQAGLLMEKSTSTPAKQRLAYYDLHVTHK